MRYAVLTAITDNYDTLQAFPAQDVEYETICVTDNPTLLGSGWNRIVLEGMSQHPNLAAKRPKCCPWEYTDAEITVWLDGSMKVTSTSFLREIAEYANPIGQFVHPHRDCIYDEGRYSLTLAKYAQEPLERQMESYREAGHPAHWGLWNGGVIVRKRTPEVEALGKAWLAEIEAWSIQDQVSEAPMLRQHDLRPRALPGVYWAGQNPWLGYCGSARH